MKNKPKGARHMFRRDKSKKASEDGYLKQWYDRIDEQEAAVGIFKNKCLGPIDFDVELECKSLMKQFKDTMQIPSKLSDIAIQLFNDNKNKE